MGSQKVHVHTIYTSNHIFLIILKSYKLKNLKKYIDVNILKTNYIELKSIFFLLLDYL